MKVPDWNRELEDVSERACLAFAARCARRVQPLFLVSWPEAPQRIYHLLDGALETVEEWAVGADRTNSTFAFNGMSAVKAAYTVGAEQAAAVASTVACASQSMAASGYGDLCVTHAAQAADYAVKVFELGNLDGRAEGLTMLIGAMKREAGVKIYDPDRESHILRRVAEQGNGPLAAAALRRLFERILDESRSQERAGNASSDSSPKRRQ